MPDSPYSIGQFIERHGITATAEPATTNPHMSDMGPEAVHFLVTLRYQSPAGAARTMAVPFSGGSPQAFSRTDGTPDARDVLGCLWSDSTSADQSFEDWCADYGYDTDSRRLYATWETVQRQTGELRRFLGDALYADLLTVDED